MRANTALKASLIALVGLMGCIDGSDDSGEGVERLGDPITETRFESPDPLGDDLEQSSSSATADMLCAPCTSKLQCGGGANYCIRRSDGVRFCGRDCRAAACPSGYSCLALSSSISQCVPPQATCGSVTPDPGAPQAPVPVPGTGDVPLSAHCAPAAQWDAKASAFEDEVLRLSNVRRQAGARCGGVAYAAAPPMTAAPALRCAARLHALDMSMGGYFSHTTPGGVSFSQRIESAGYVWRTVGENIALGYETPQAVVDGWMRSAGHCRNIMNSGFSQMGVGLHGTGVWTQDFGAPL